MRRTTTGQIEPDRPVKQARGRDAIAARAPFSGTSCYGYGG